MTYVRDQTWQEYPEFRAKLQQLMERHGLDDEKISALQRGIAPFDRRYGWSGA